MRKKAVDLFEYHDFRDFLRDWFNQARESQSLSLREIALQCGLSTGFLPMLLSGQRTLSDKSLSKLQAALKLNKEELAYLKALIRLCDGETAEERSLAFEEIRKLRSFRKKNPKELEVHQYLSSWLHVAIREMAFRHDFEPDPAWIRPRLVRKVALKDIQDSLEFLLEHEFLTRDQKGRVVPSQKHLECFSGVYRLSLGEFHKQMFALASESIDLTPREQRNLLGHTLLIPESQIGNLRSILDETLNKVAALGANVDEAGPVYHVILSTFPLSKKA